MDYQTFRGTGVQEALLHVREALGTGALIESTRGTLAARAGYRELRKCLRQRAGENLECKTGLIETPGRRLVTRVGPTGVGKTTTLAKMAARAVCLSNGACAW